jgi:hypothetical protein
VLVVAVGVAVGDSLAVPRGTLVVLQAVGTQRRVDPSQVPAGDSPAKVAHRSQGLLEEGSLPALAEVELRNRAVGHRSLVGVLLGSRAAHSPEVHQGSLAGHPDSQQEGALRNRSVGHRNLVGVLLGGSPGVLLGGSPGVRLGGRPAVGILPAGDSLGGQGLQDSQEGVRPEGILLGQVLRSHQASWCLETEVVAYSS